MVNFENGTLVKGAYVEINGVEYPVHMPEYSGTTPLNAENLNKMQNDILNKIQEEDFTNKVTFNENKANCIFVKKGNMVFISYQGESKAHTAGTELFTISEGYRPKKSQVFSPFTKNTNSYGQVCLDSSGSLFVNQISSTTAEGRIYFQMFYIAEEV